MRSETKKGNNMTMITFQNDVQRKAFQIKNALNVLEFESINTFGMRMSAKINILKVLARLGFDGVCGPKLPRTRKGAYKLLRQKGYYKKCN
jgi:hypothetical protein